MTPTDFQCRCRQQAVQTTGQPGFAVLLTQPVLFQIRFVKAETAQLHPLSQQRLGQCILTVGHHHSCTTIDALLGQGVVLHALIAVQMVRADIEHSGRRRTQFMGSFQLKTGQFQYVEVSRRLQQIQCRGADIAAHPCLDTRSSRHLTYQRRDRTFGIGAGDRHNRSRGFTAEQVDIADQGRTGNGGRHNGGMALVDAGADDQLLRTTEPIAVQLTQAQLHGGKFGTEGIGCSRRLTGITDSKGNAAALKVARTGEPGLTQTDNNALFVSGDQTHSALLR